MNTFENSFGTQFYSKIDKQQPCFGITIPQKQFKRSQNAPQFGINPNKPKLNIKQFQFQQKIILLKIELKLQSIFNILEPKVYNIKRSIFKSLQNTQNPQQILSMQQNLSILNIEQVVNKISNFVKHQRIKLLSKGFSNLILKNIMVSRIQVMNKGKKKLSDKRDSQMLRVNSKLDENSLHVSDLMGDGQGSNYSNSNVKLRNKELRKKKKKIDSNVNTLFSKMDQLISYHQNHLETINKKK